MKFYWKMQILLLIISLIPLIGTAVLYHSFTTKLANDLALESQEILATTTHAFLQNLVESYGKILNRDKEILELLLSTQAKEVNYRLARHPVGLPTFYLSKDFEEDNALIRGMTVTGKHFKADDDITRSVLPVTYENQAYFTVEGLNLTEVVDDIANLSSMPASYKQLYQLKPGLLLWQYTALESGLHTSYPGSGGIPADYDPRKRMWYQMAKQNNSLSWGPPVIDALTQSIVLTLSKPVHRPDGSFAGVTAIDVLISDIFKELKLPAQWVSRATMTSVVPVHDKKTGREKLTIIAQMSYLDLKQSWHTPVSLEFLESDNPSDLKKIIDEAKAGKSGVCTIRHKGEESLWAYGASGAGSAFPLIILPYDLVLAQATATKTHVLKTTHKGLMVTAFILLIVMAMVTLLAVFFSRRVTRPLTQLSEAAKQLSLGNYQMQVEIKTRDELQELGAIFNRMGPQLQEAMENIKSHQRQLLQADKMASLGILVSGVAHEINNPNALILLNLPQLKRAWKDIEVILKELFIDQGDFHIGDLSYSELTTDVPEILEEMEVGAMRIKRIVNDLKDYSRLDNARLTESFDLNEVAQSAIRLVRTQLKKSTSDFSTDLEANLPLTKGNKQRIEQVVINLLLNACQALEQPEQSIILRTQFEAERKELILIVEDKGRGIPPDHLSLLTDPFFTTHRENGGTGLGLSISAGIAEEHGGRLEFSSTVGQGTTVLLILPHKNDHNED